MSTFDAIIVGGGHNGLVAGLYLAQAGWTVAVVERNATVGGSIASSELTLPDHIHDVYSMNQNLFLGSGACADFGADLARVGLRFRTTDRPYSNVFPGERSLRVYRDHASTIEGLRQHNPADADGFEALYALYKRFAPHLFALYGSSLRSSRAVRELVGLLRSQRIGGTSQLAQILLMSTRELGDSWLATPEARAMAACWGMHLDFGPDVSGGAMFPFLQMFGDMENGMSVVEGGAQRLPNALQALLLERGAKVFTGQEVTSIVCSGGVASGVRTADGTELRATKAVIAGVGPRALYDRLLPRAKVPADVLRRARRFQYGPGTMMVHLALTNPLPWAAGDDLSTFGYVHVGPYVDDLAATYAQAQAGLLPSDPLLIVGQTSAIDPGRAPAGKHVVWIQVRMVPSNIRGDAAGQLRETAWPAVAEAMAERVISKVESYAPGARAVISQWAVHTPHDLETANPNLVGGDSVSGSHHLAQNFLFRPLGSSGYRTSVRRLYLTGAATWPGAGNNATSGRLAAQQALQDSRWGRISRGRRPGR